jgi:hypothetical protein
VLGRWSQQPVDQRLQPVGFGNDHACIALLGR